MGMVNRKGMGRVRHVEVGELWIQDAVKQKKMTLAKVKGEENPADILTKHVDRGKIREHCARLNMVQEKGSSRGCPYHCNIITRCHPGDFVSLVSRGPRLL